MVSDVRLVVPILALAVALAACEGVVPDEAGPITDCPEDKLYYAEACDEWFCGPPSVRVGDGRGHFAPLEEGDDVAI